MMVKASARQSAATPTEDSKGNSVRHQQLMVGSFLMNANTQKQNLMMRETAGFNMTPQVSSMNQSPGMMTPTVHQEANTGSSTTL